MIIHCMKRWLMFLRELRLIVLLMMMKLNLIFVIKGLHSALVRSYNNTLSFISLPSLLPPFTLFFSLYSPFSLSLLSLCLFFCLFSGVFSAIMSYIQLFCSTDYTEQEPLLKLSCSCLQAIARRNTQARDSCIICILF